MKKIYMVSDLDHTLLNSEKKVSHKNIEAIQKFIDAGNYFGIATGRSFQSAYEYISVLPLQGPSIFCNGALIMDQQGNILHEYPLDKTDFLSFFHAVEQALPNAKITVFLKDSYLDLSHSSKKIDFQSNIQKIMDQAWYKVLITENQNPSLAFQLAKQYLNDNTYCMFSDTNLMEIMSKGISKGQALQALAKEYHCFSVAVGDYENDIEMIEMADFGVAVENALDCVKQKANYIGKHHDEDAIADVIDQVMKME